MHAKQHSNRIPTRGTQTIFGDIGNLQNQKYKCKQKYIYVLNENTQSVVGRQSCIYSSTVTEIQGEQLVFFFFFGE